MKKIDIYIYIINAFLVSVSTITVYGLIESFDCTLSIISFLLTVLYVVFFISHIALLYPFLVLKFAIEEFLENFKSFKRLSEQSVILSKGLFLILFSSIIFIIYGAIPIGISMLHNKSTNLNQAIETIKTFSSHE